MIIERREINEMPKDTVEFIDSKRSWDVVNQCYRDSENDSYYALISECDIYWRGKYLIIEHKGIIHFWEMEGNYCYLEQAVELFRIDIPKKWKTMVKLISLREAIRQTEVNLCGLVDDLLVGKRMTLKLYRQFMKLARQQDLEHHGQHTF